MLCVIAKIDERGTERLNSLREAAMELGCMPKKLFGHITLVAYLDFVALNNA